MFHEILHYSILRFYCHQQMMSVLNERGKYLVLSQKFKGQKIYKHPYLSYIIVLDKIYLFLPKYRAATTKIISTRSLSPLGLVNFSEYDSYIAHWPLKSILKLF